MSDIITERTNGILRVEFNRPERKNAMTSGMYVRLADIFNEAAEDEETRVVLWHSAGDTFCAGNDIGDFLKPPGPGESPQARLMDAFIRFEKPIVVAVQGAAVGGGTTMLTHCDFVYAGRARSSSCRSSIWHSCRSLDPATRCQRVSAISGRRNYSCWVSPSVPCRRRSWAW